MNGQPRIARVPNRSAVSRVRARRKADESDPAHVAAPMPGFVVSVAVKVGQPVKSGDLLLSVEAMKMQTAIHARRDGTIAEVLVLLQRAIVPMTQEESVVKIEPGKYGFPIDFKSRYGNYIGGQWVAPAGGQYFDNITPITGKPFCEIARSTAEDVERALDAAHAAKRAWAKTSTTERANLLIKIRRSHGSQSRPPGARRDLG